VPNLVMAIIEMMPDFVRPSRPRVPNPADPAEDYADKWAKDARLEKIFWDWHTALKADIAKLPALLRGTTLKADMQALFRVDLTQNEQRQFESQTRSPATVQVAPTLIIPSAPKPWGTDA
jgi:hypothetical protein